MVQCNRTAVHDQLLQHDFTPPGTVGFVSPQRSLLPVPLPELRSLFRQVAASLVVAVETARPMTKKSALDVPQLP